MTAPAGEEVDGLDGDEVENSESEGQQDSKNEDGSGDDSSERKNSSNWKKMSAAKKEAERRAEVAESKALELERNLAKVQEWADSLYERDEDKPFKKKEEPAGSESDSLQEQIFVLKNPEAEEHLEEIRDTRKKFQWMDFKSAWKFVKADLPPESVSKKDFDLNGKPPTKTVDLKSVSEADSVNLSKEDRSKWRKMHGYV